MPPRSPLAQRDKPVLDAAVLRKRCAATEPLLVGLEEELMVLDAETLDLAPCAPQLLARLDGDPRFKLELPAAQIELVTSPEATVPAAAAQLARGRALLEAVAGPDLRVAGAGVHPFAAPRGVVNSGERYDATVAEYGPIAERQLVFGLHVHVSVGDADRAVTIHDALRSYLPEIAALAANAPFYDGSDSGLASVRPKVSELLPRQGVPPVIGSLEAYAEELRWGARSGAVPHPRRWWWGLRVHPEIGTIEVRIPDTQTTAGETAAVAALVQALVGHLVARHAAGEVLAVAPTWRIDANRWSACRHGVAGEMADLCTGEREPTPERLLRLIDDLTESARALGCARALDGARGMIEAGGPAAAQRRVAARADLRDVVRELADRFGESS